MKTLAEIEAAIAKLPPADFRELLRWMQVRHEELWAKQIEEDARSGALERAWQRARREIAEGDIVPLDEFLREL